VLAYAADETALAKALVAIEQAAAVHA
jgi:hypothetical protein